MRLAVYPAEGVDASSVSCGMSAFINEYSCMLVDCKEGDVDILSHLFEKYSGTSPMDICRMEGAGSDRRYYRLTGVGPDGRPGFSCVGVAGGNDKDNRAFVALSLRLGNAGLPVPEVYCVSDDGSRYLQQDLGGESLFDLIEKEGEGSPVVAEAVTRAMCSLARLHSLPPELWEDVLEYPPFGRRQCMWDLNYFKYEYLRISGVDFDEDLLEDDFELMTADLCRESIVPGFMYRDCQSRNVMMKGGDPHWIDYQGGRRGPGVYDAVSFLWQARAGFSDEFRQRMLDIYFSERRKLSSDYSSVDAEMRLTGVFALFRTLQVLGAYGLRGLVEKKSHFIKSIPSALTNLRKLVDEGICESYPELRRTALAICADPRFAEASVTDGRLCVRVFSFSYKKGYPADYSGNGGGFMFDCRGMHNPGRYAEYRPLTGRDAAVIDFLEERGEVFGFVDRAVEIVAPSIETYLRRGFSSLQVGFGCTGGRHRSVYCAERTARLLAARYPEARIELCHREQGITEYL